jgi:hypothetical protein
MQSASLESFLALLENMGHAIIKAARNLVRAMATMSWPVLLVTCVALAMAVSIIPLALLLFIVFLAVKLVLAAIILSARRGRAKVGPRHE